MFSKLDDYDILLSIKEWVHHKDKVLSTLSKMIIERKLLKVEIKNEHFNDVYISKKQQKFEERLNSLALEGWRAVSIASDSGLVKVLMEKTR